jgi:hypothetical protein
MIELVEMHYTTQLLRFISVEESGNSMAQYINYVWTSRKQARSRAYYTTFSLNWIYS